MAKSQEKPQTDLAKAGAVKKFNTSWNELGNSQRYHYTAHKPKNQTQFAFQQHWEVFKEIMGEVSKGRVLEVGCGRGSMGAFFSEEGFETHLLDTSIDALNYARKNFELDGLSYQPVNGDALNLPYPDGVFDVVVSIGLLEHFENIEQPLTEQWRILRDDGIFLGYVVPGGKANVQLIGKPINTFLKLIYKTYFFFTRSNNEKSVEKKDLYRNDYQSKDYLEIIGQLSPENSGSFGMFPIPLISHSPEFPFTWMSPPLERALVSLWKMILSVPRLGVHPWVCPEFWGQAFLVWGKK